MKKVFEVTVNGSPGLLFSNMKKAHAHYADLCQDIKKPVGYSAIAASFESKGFFDDYAKDWEVRIEKKEVL